MTGLGNKSHNGVVTCNHCGAAYEKTSENVGMKDRDSFTCYCGEILEKWNSIWVPSFHRIAGTGGGSE